MLAANHSSNFDPWPLGFPLWPSRQLYFMAKIELFNPILGPILRSGGAFPVRRGEQDLSAIETAIRLCREGKIVAMFPEGHSTAEGVAQEVHRAASRRLGSDRPRGRRSAGAGCHQGHGPDLPVGPAEGRVRATDRRSKTSPACHPATPRAVATDRLMAEIDALYAEPVSSLLAIDGDSLAHRAYHGLPRTIKGAGGRPAGALVGFAGFFVDSGSRSVPERCSSRWDTLEAPTYRHAAFGDYQSGREFDADLLEQLRLLPELVEACGFAVAKAAGYEADDFLAAAAAAEESRGGTVLVATSDRDAFQLASERTTILQPIRRVSELARIGPADVRERYGVDPSQVPDFIALRGDPSDRLPGRGVSVRRRQRPSWPSSGRSRTRS